jgi:GNAT superfamily N-acetyltransferase
MGRDDTRSTGVMSSGVRSAGHEAGGGVSGRGAHATPMGVAARRLLRRAILGTGWLVRLQWFVTNVAPVPAVGCAPPLPGGVSVRVGSPADAEVLAPFIRGRESLAWRFAPRDLVLVAELDGLVIGCTWLTRHALRPSYFPIRVCPTADEWYNYGLALLRQHRARGLGRVLSRMAMAHAGQCGARKIFGHASRFNRIAATSHKAAGFITVEDLIGLTVLNRFTVILYRRPRTTRD